MRGNGKIIQELEGLFRGAGWNVIKVIWGTDWDDLLARDKSGLLLKRMEEAVDGDYQKYSVEPGSYTRKHFFGKYPELLELVNHLTDEQISKLLRGGHDARKMYAAYKAAIEHKGQPTVILAKTVKGYGLGEAGEGRNISHQQKKMNEKELREFRERFKIPISDDVIAETPFFRPPPDSPEIKYLLERRKALGGFLPERKVTAPPLDVPKLDSFAEFFKGSATEASTTMAFVRLVERLAAAQRHQPEYRADHSRRGADVRPGRVVQGHRHLLVQRPALRAGGQQVAALLPRSQGRPDSGRRHHRGRLDGVIHCGGHQLRHARRADDSVLHLLFDVRTATRRRFVLARGRHPGERLFARRHRRPHHAQRRRACNIRTATACCTPAPFRRCLPYDPAFGYELAVIIADGLRRMYAEGEDIFYYLSLYNENYAMPPMPAGVEDGILKGLYKFKPGPEGKKIKAHIFGSGPIINSALKAQEILAERYGVSADVWSATSYKLLRTDAIRCQRWNMLHPTQPPKKSYVETLLAKEQGAFVAVSDNIRTVPDQIAPWVPGGLFTLGTDGFGRSDTRARLAPIF